MNPQQVTLCVQTHDCQSKVTGKPVVVGILHNHVRNHATHTRGNMGNEHELWLKKANALSCSSHVVEGQVFGQRVHLNINRWSSTSCPCPTLTCIPKRIGHLISNTCQSTYKLSQLNRQLARSKQSLAPRLRIPHHI